MRSDHRQFLYRVRPNGSIESRLFERGDDIPLPSTWADSPAKAKEKPLIVGVPGLVVASNRPAAGFLPPRPAAVTEPAADTPPAPTICPICGSEFACEHRGPSFLTAMAKRRGRPPGSKNKTAGHKR